MGGASDDNYFSALRTLTAALSSVQGATSAGEALCREIIRVAPVRSVELLLLARDGGDSECIAACGPVSLSPGTRVRGDEDSSLAHAIRRRQAHFNDDEAVIILQSNGFAHGALALRFSHPPDAGARAYIDTVAQLGALAFERARLAESERIVRAEAYRVYSQLEALAHAGELTSSSRDVDATVRTIVSLALPEFADGCVFEALDENLPALEVGHCEAPQVALWRARLAKRPLHADDQIAKIATRGAAELLQDLAADMRSVIVVPLVERQVTFAILYFVRSTRDYEESDVPFAHELSRRLSSALENARLYEEAQRAIQLRDDFISIAAHELKTPLAALRMRLRMMVAKTLGTSAQPSAERCESYASDLNDLVNQLLDTTRIAAGQMRLDIEKLDLSLVVRDVVQRFSDVAAQEKVALAVDVPSGLVGDFDRLKLELVVGNLVSNAIKYGDKSEVRVRAFRTGETCRIEVADSGPGIDEAEQTRLFRRFHRGPQRSVGGGFGLGLWIVKQVSEAQGGRVSLKSAPGKGATFIVELPLARRKFDAVAFSP